MLRAGVDLPRSMAVTAESSNNAVYRTALEKIREAMMQGQDSPSQSPKWAISGGRRQCFVWVRKRHFGSATRSRGCILWRELETKLERATALFEPAIIILMELL